MGKKIESKDLRCRKRENLAAVIPLPAPYAVYIEPSNLCNFRCIFCPTGDKELLKQVGRPAGNMPMELFRKIVDGLAALGKELRLVNLYKDGEPLLNPHFPEMIAFLKSSGITRRIWTKTNGALLNPELNRKLVEAGLDWIGISVEATTAAGYRKVAGIELDYGKFRENIADLYRNRGNCEVYIKIADSGLSQEEINRFYADFSDICNFCAVEKLMGWSYSDVKDFTLGTKPDTYDGLPFTKKEVCPYPFYIMAFNFNGTVSLCGNDWSHGTTVGDITRETVADVWNGERLYEFRRMLLEGRRAENRACGNCYYLKIVPDNIDNHRDEILKKLTLLRNRKG